MPKDIFQHLKKVRVRQYPLNLSRLDGLGFGQQQPTPKRAASGRKTAKAEVDAPSTRKIRKRSP